MTTPSMTITKLNDCCVARATFSFPLNSVHLYLPSSEITEMCFLVGPEPDWPPRLLCVAYHRASPLGVTALEAKTVATKGFDARKGSELSRRELLIAVPGHVQEPRHRHITSVKVCC